ncbi:MAG: hypothetical protein QG657_5760 [Acidobacteriota bacterium]|nr:hypothetical protein [Acidobacteriota bacterium]
MGRKMRVLVLTVMWIGLTCFAFSQGSEVGNGKESGTDFTVSKFAVGTGVENRELIGESQSFPAETETVYCFLDAKDIAANIQVVFVWFYNEKEANRTTLTLKQGSRWRTWADKGVAGKKGDWKVQLQYASGAVVNSQPFKVD